MTEHLGSRYVDTLSIQGGSPIDLPWESSSRIQHAKTRDDLEDALKKLHKGPVLFYVYSPTCFYSRQGAPIFEKSIADMTAEEFKHVTVYRYNAVPSTELKTIQKAHSLFQEMILHEQIPHYPMVLGISKQGRIVEYKGPVSHETLVTFVKALEKT